LNHVQLSGPTYFAPLIRESMKMAQQKKDNGSMEYTIVVIMTDGQINDMEETTDALVEAAYLPLSAIVIGIGHADFRNMEVLDADYGDLRHTNGTISQREIVQFVPYSKFKHNHDELAKHVLEKIPNQLTQYYRMVNIVPRAPILMDPNQPNMNLAALNTQQRVGGGLGGLGGIGGGMNAMGNNIGNNTMGLIPNTQNNKGGSNQMGLGLGMNGIVSTGMNNAMNMGGMNTGMNMGMNNGMNTGMNMGMNNGMNTGINGMSPFSMNGQVLSDVQIQQLGGNYAKFSGN